MDQPHPGGPNRCLLCDLSTVIASNTGEPDDPERPQRAAERILDDERLTSDLTDDQARPLIEWASYQAALVASDPNRSDEDVDAAVTALRRAVLRVASIAPDEHDPERLLALARQQLEALQAAEQPEQPEEAGG
ncbi:MAG: hypothetical protein HC884_03305 [Chloroflexaceae bacterium]|nr:hypothetical protein [Chloroflexaceae bacterium]